ncbi:CPBP family intramembrane glutamic endopeptidase [Tenacibaculum jejuense]|uniref:Abortive infection protein n=1 Tax=Tenacibaculum jejuense TaxID=584609 RepID=A0A238U780_9FLAO|nr:CPBP family intramembrane glutamic endopeptidase [Tenacibaculum jejuense]SNR14334.1 Abortive infection protein [Tenacibaculum jejuense]
MKKALQYTILFIILILLKSIINVNIKSYLIFHNVENYNIVLVTKTVSNIILGIISILIVKKLDLVKFSGIRPVKIEKKLLLIFPLVYIVGLNLLFADDIPNFTTTNLIVLLTYCLSIGIAEELSLRSVLIPLLIKYFGDSKKSIIKSVLIAATIFGLLHFIKFDKGVYGEISQFFFATFIGVMFGALLIVTKRIYPLIIIHMLIDFAAKLDDIGVNFKPEGISETDLTGAIFTVIITLPCLFYGMYIMKKHIPNELSITE